MGKRIADGVFGLGTIAVGVVMLLYGVGWFETAAGVWCCLAGGYTATGVFDEEPRRGAAGGN